MSIRPPDTGSTLSASRLFCAPLVFLLFYLLAALPAQADNEPYTFFEGRKPTGFSIDVLRLIEQRSHLRFDIRAGSWPDIYAAFLRGDLDAIDGISWRPDRAQTIRFTEPYHTREIYLLQDSERPLPRIRQLEDLAGLRVGMVEDIFYGQELLDAGLSVNQYDSLPSLVRALAFGWIDAAVGPRLTLEYLSNKNGFRFLELHGPAPLERFSGEDFRIGVSIDNAALAQDLQQALDAIPDTTIDNLLKRWQEFGGNYSVDTNGNLPLDARQRQYLANLGPIRVGFTEDYAPFSFADGGQLRGLSVDIMDRLADITGLQVIPVPAQWQELTAMLKRGDIDVLANMSYRPERESLARFTEPYHNIPNVVFTLDETLAYERLEDLADQRVALGTGIYYEATVRDRLGDDHVIAYTAQQDMFRALSKGKVDAVLTALHSGNYWIRELGISGARIAGELQIPGMAGEDLRFGVRPSLSPLADILNQSLASMTPTEKRVIENRWLGASLATASYYMQSLGLADLKVLTRVPSDWTLSMATRNDEPVLHGIMQKLVSSLTAEDRRKLESNWRQFEIKQKVDYTLLLFYWNRKLGRLNRELASANAALSYLSVTDALTGLGNRTFFDREFEKSFQWCQRHQQGFAVAMVDADLFKQINDTRGHHVGDQCLKTLATLMREHFRRDTDRLSRFGGEEFVWFTSYREIADIITRLEGFREAVAAYHARQEKPELSLTVSIGLAYGIPGPDSAPAEYLRLADQALYRAKHNGRNRLESAPVTDRQPPPTHL